MKKINTGTSDFEDLIKSECIYVDKTAYMRRLASDVGNKVVFMSHPRRFGKSLTVSAFKAIFQGRRELFRGLDIERLGWTWQTHPVIHFRFSEASTDSLERFDKTFSGIVKDSLAAAGYEYDDKKDYSLNFANAIEALHAKSVKDHEAAPSGSSGSRLIPRRAISSIAGRNGLEKDS